MKLTKKIALDNIIDINQLIYPLFVREGKGSSRKVFSMPGVNVYSLSGLLKQVAYLNKIGLRKFLIFGVPKSKTWQGKYAYENSNIVAKAVKEIKEKFPKIVVMTDVCLCAYNLHGHCGIIPRGKSSINSAATLKALSLMALSHAKAGVDFVAPSAMVNNQVRAIRQILDKEGFSKVKIMSYSAKFASNFYGPFRNIADSKPRFGDRSKYQLNYSKAKEALARIKKDIKQGADIVMVKPALGYLDIVKEAKAKLKHPLAVYNVSGEYSLVKQGAKLRFWDQKRIVDEVITSIKRAGADFIITYHAKDIAVWQKG